VFSAERIRDWILLVFCNFIWASQFVMVKIVQAQLGPVSATFLPMLLATLLLIPVVAWERSRSPASLRSARMPGKHVGQFILIGVLGQVVAQLFITWGVRYSLASNAALLMLTLPVCTAVMAYFLLSEHMTSIRWISFGLAIAGVVECSGVDWRELNMTGSQFLLGNALIFLSVNGSAFYNVYSKKLLEHYTPLQVLLFSYYAVIAFLAPIAVALEPRGFVDMPQYTLKTWIGIGILAIFQYFISMVIFLIVLARLDAIQASLCNYLIPFFGLVIAAVVLGERLTWYMILGGMLVLASTLLVTAYEERQRTKQESDTMPVRP
jgi:drug/metabolite transporter (DMT)-like permease